jgi:hypothetical protein
VRAFENAKTAPPPIGLAAFLLCRSLRISAGI